MFVFKEIAWLHRFFTKVEMPNGENGCWLWTGQLNDDGYGLFRPDARGGHGAPHKNRVFTHRLIYKSLMGEIPINMEIDHLCRNRSCAQPKHLEPVIHHENVLRGALVGHKHNLGEKHGKAKITEQDVRDIRTDGTGTSAISKKYGFAGISAVHSIKKHKNWAHVQDSEEVKKIIGARTAQFLLGKIS